MGLGCKAPYFATSTLEAFFHVSTMLTPSYLDAQDCQKLYQVRWANIGNDQVHVIWCERAADHELGQLPTEVVSICHPSCLTSYSLAR
jgi:hypothetical protein